MLYGFDPLASRVTLQNQATLAIQYVLLFRFHVVAPLHSHEENIARVFEYAFFCTLSEKMHIQ